MREEDYPALYRAADAASNEAQASLLSSHKITTLLLVCAAATALASTVTTGLAILSAVLFLGSLLFYIYGQSRNFQDRWYRARALAESVKTATWRLVMSADPFAQPDEETNLEIFRKLLTELLQENKAIGSELAGEASSQAQVTQEMLNAFRETFETKKARYLEERIENQRKWYAKKSGDNRKASKKYFAVICVVYCLAIVLLLIRIAAPGTPFLPIEVLAVVASSIIAWRQIKRYDELASAYGLTAHELGIIKSRYGSVENSEHLARFVSDAENAFSREHTQWAARRDH